MSSTKGLGVRLLKVASVYLLAGLLVGLAMGISKDFRLMSVHSHVLLLGWATLAITGIVYLVLPGCAGTRLAAAHFWLHNLGLPALVAGLAAEAFADPRAEPVVGVGSAVVVVALGLFTLNVLRHAGAPDPART